MSEQLKRRVIACVDGTWYDADGQEGQGHGNNSNVFRIFAATGRGIVKGTQGDQVEQIVEYFPGIGTNERPLEKFNSGITGDGCAEQIARVYKYCCRHLRGSQDELWFYGFSRGAYVVTAVAGLLDRIGALTYDEDFDKTYEQALILLKALEKGRSKENSGKIFYLRTKQSRECPHIHFLGLLDTVKRVNDDLDATNTYSLTFHDSLRHVRHALALNDTRSHFKPQVYGPISDTCALQDRSLIEAWFVGAHADIGGGARDDGLSLYPLQWLLIESQHQGLILEHTPETIPIEDPLDLVFPAQRKDRADAGAHLTSQPWEYQYSNGTKIKMQDMRISHNHGNMQTLARKLTKKRFGVDESRRSRTIASMPNKGLAVAVDPLEPPRRHSDGDAQRKRGGFKNLFSRKKPSMASSDAVNPPKITTVLEANPKEYFQHIIRLNSGFPYVTFQSYREPFRNNRLHGYFESKYGGFGTVIHPSVYFIMDVYSRHGIGSAMKHFERDIIRFRNEQHPSVRDPWLTLEMEAAPQADVKACRILVCGRTGVGKSTLINKVFGVPMTIESHMKQGDHDINEAFESDSHPGIIIHDSRGFQAADSTELEQFARFIKKRSGLQDPKESLHTIWICIDTDTDRAVQTSEIEIFKILAAHAANVPVIIVGTKKDKFLDQQETVARRKLTHSISDPIDLNKQSQIMAEQELRTRQTAFRNELAYIPNLDIDSIQFIHVSKDDENSIKYLLNQTVELIMNDEARLRCIAAQVIDMETKIEQAIDESMRLLRRGVVTSTVGASIPIFVHSISTPTISRILCDNILRCFGFPKIDAANVDYIMHKIVGWNLIRFLSHQVGQSVILGFPMAGSIFASLGGSTPMIAMLEAPAAARMIVKCACDLILILDRAFKHGGKFVMRKDITLACQEYITRPANSGRTRRKRVHAQVMELIPIFSKKFWGGARIAKIRGGMEDIISENRWEPEKLTTRAESPAIVLPSSPVELPPGSPAELSAGSPAELPADTPLGSVVTKLSMESLQDEMDTRTMFAK